MKVEEIKPYSKDADKGEEVEKMFDSISRRYDLMNTAMSLGQFKVWRNKALKTAIEQLPLKDSYNILDVATGTGDVAFRLHTLLPMAKITGIDLSEGMLRIARNKLVELKPEERELIVFGKGDSLSMPFHDGMFNMVSVAYGIRNFSNIGKGLKEINRVLCNDGVLCVIELSTPEGKITKKAYNFYAGKPFLKLLYYHTPGAHYFRRGHPLSVKHAGGEFVTVSHLKASFLHIIHNRGAKSNNQQSSLFECGKKLLSSVNKFLNTVIFHERGK